MTGFHSGDIFKIFSDHQVTKYYNMLPLINETEAQKIIQHFSNKFESNTGIRWGIALKGQQNIIGTCGFNNFTKHHRANLGYDLQSAFWNNGLITEALSALLNFGFNTLELNRIEAEVMQGNLASNKVLTKLNFTNEGILKQWMFWNGKHYDMTMFALLKSEYERKLKIKFCKIPETIFYCRHSNFICRSNDSIICTR
jgi:ribosomal-protein-alanine N-acetyltransferase